VSPETDALLTRAAAQLDRLWPGLNYGASLRRHPYGREIERYRTMAHGVRVHVRSERARRLADATYDVLWALLVALDGGAAAAPMTPVEVEAAPAADAGIGGAR